MWGVVSGRLMILEFTAALEGAMAGGTLGQMGPRKHHDNWNTLVVGDWRRGPRSVVCTS